MSLYIYAGIAIVILFLISSIIRYWNLPKTIEERRLAQESRAKAQDERREDAIRRRQIREKARADRIAARRKRP